MTRRSPSADLRFSSTMIPWRGLARRALPALVLLALLGVPGPTDAQTVIGNLKQSGSDQAIVSATVLLVDTTGVVVDQTMTNDDGAFVLEAAEPGAYLVIAEALGYKPTVDGILELGEGGRITVDFFLKPKPIELETIRAVVERIQRSRSLDASGFFDRMEQGLGHFIPPEEVERQNAFDVADLLRSVPGIRVAESSMGGSAIFIRRPSLRSSNCPATVWVDGMRAAGVGAAPVIEEYVTVEDVEAVEVYTGAASTPLQYGGLADSCGAVLIWTKGE